MSLPEAIAALLYGALVTALILSVLGGLTNWRKKK